MNYYILGFSKKRIFKKIENHYFSVLKILEKKYMENKSKHQIFIKKKKNKLSRYITKATVPLNKDLNSLKEKPYQQEMRCKMMGGWRNRSK